MKTITISAFLIMAAGTAYADIPLLNATCPGNIEVHADKGGPIFINGRQAQLKVFNKNYYEARGGGVTISLSINPDGSPAVSYTGRGGANGICQLVAGGMPGGNTGGGGDYADGDAGGPDFWAVTGVGSDDRLNVRAGPSTQNQIVARLRNGAVVRNLGCSRRGNSRWCRIGTMASNSVEGWVNGRYLREAARPSGNTGNTAEVPELFARPTGEFEVRWRSGCTALFSNNGNRITAGSTCSNAQMRRSADAVAAYRREQGIGGGQQSGGTSAGGYELIAGSKGGVEVKFRSGCWISYDRNGVRGGHAGQCSQSQYERADNAARSYLR